MRFDLRIPVGMLFVLLGMLLTGYGMLAPVDQYRHSHGVNVNIAWGGTILLFGILMLALAWWARPSSATTVPSRSDVEHDTHGRHS